VKRLFRTIQRLVRANSREIRFVLLFVLIFVAIQSLYFFSRPLRIPYRLQVMNALVSSSLINTFTPAENTNVAGKSLESGDFALEIAWGCEGIEGIFLIIAALSAYYMRPRDKLLGILVGTAFLYCLNIVRIMGLYYTIKYKPAVFDIMHMYVGQTFIIFFGVLFFVAWTYRFSSPAPVIRKSPIGDDTRS